ncbi:MAG: hypothetical protein GX078_03815 [Clostridiales bacterium]|nr:hypothetical protein [Clostridiales bacterium]
MAKNLNLFRLLIRVLTIIVLIVGLPFYLGYGNPLPFMNPNYNMLDNLWLTVFPIMFLGLFISMRFHKAGGYIVAVPVAFNLVLGFFINGNLSTIMLIPLVIGVMNIIIGYMDEDNINSR